MDFEDLDPKEQAEIKVDYAIRDAWLAITEAHKLMNDPVARPYVMKQRADLWSMKTKLDLLLSAIDAIESKKEAA